MKRWRSRDLGQLFVSLGLLAIGGYTLVEARSIEAIRGYEQLGPRLFPNLIGACLLIIGTLLGWQAVAGGWRLMPEAEHPPPYWPAFGFIGAALIFQMATIASLGFVASSTVLIVLVARGMGSRRWLRDLAIGLALAAAAYYFTTMVLHLYLPASPLKVI